MVLILDGNSDHVAHACRKIGHFEHKKDPVFTAIGQMP